MRRSLALEWIESRTFVVSINIRQCFAQTSEQSAEVRAGLGIGSVGPEGDGQLLAGLRLIAVQHEIGQQRLQPIGL